jgi:hypothetical protein
MCLASHARLCAQIDLLPGGGGAVTLLPEKVAEIGSLQDLIARWKEQLPDAHIVAISAAEGTGTDDMLKVHVCTKNHPELFNGPSAEVWPVALAPRALCWQLLRFHRFRLFWQGE